MPARPFDVADYNAKRQVLARALPLDVPYSARFFVSNLCNFRCYYCYQRLPKEETGGENGLIRRLMDRAVFTRRIDELAALGPVKKLLIYGNGEPLLHPEIGEMVAYATASGAARVVEVITNGALLTPEMSDRLIAAGLHSLRVSLQGLSAGDIARTCGAQIDYERFLWNLRYFYTHKRGTHVYIKILDAMVPDEESRRRFYSQYGPLCDEIAVEHMIPLAGTPPAGRGMRGNEKVRTSICAMPFYSCTVDCDGLVAPCCSVPFPQKFGQGGETLAQIWNSPAYNAFLLRLLRGEKGSMPVCGACCVPTYITQPSDVLDDAAPSLLPRYQGRACPVCPPDAPNRRTPQERNGL